MPTGKFDVPEKYNYLTGFGSAHSTEAIPGALPVGANAPQHPPFGLYAEKLSGTAFTAPRSQNQQTWLYRVLPSCTHAAFEPVSAASSGIEVPTKHDALNWIPNQLRWDPFDVDEKEFDWMTGMRHVAGAGDPAVKTGFGIYVFSASRDMAANTATYSSDGDMLIVQQQGVLDIQTELGRLLVRPNEICVIPRGIKYRVTLPNGSVRGYILELHQGHYQLPELGPIGSDGLANARDFQVPVACYDEDGVPCLGDATAPAEWTVVAKYNCGFFSSRLNHTPFDVVAWHGKYYPYKYDLGRFNAIGSTSYDHPDPSIYTVLTGPSDNPGTAIADFVIFPPRWLVQEDTFRPPWYHRNTMSEFMGLVCGKYDGKSKGGFAPGGASLHNVMSAHGPDAGTFENATSGELKPHKVGVDSMAFMFESCLMMGVSEWGLKNCRKVQEQYSEESWSGLKSRFKKPA